MFYFVRCNYQLTITWLPTTLASLITSFCPNTEYCKVENTDRTSQRCHSERLSSSGEVWHVVSDTTGLVFVFFTRVDKTGKKVYIINHIYRSIFHVLIPLTPCENIHWSASYSNVEMFTILSFTYPQGDKSSVHLVICYMWYFKSISFNDK